VLAQWVARWGLLAVGVIVAVVVLVAEARARGHGSAGTPAGRPEPPELDRIR
jgi:hypothetical protein